MARKKEAQRRAEFENLLTPHLEALYGTAIRLTRKPDEAEDLVQDACLKAYRFIDRFEPGTNFKAWIFKIMTNLFITRYRKKQREREVCREVYAEGHATSRMVAQGPSRDARRPEERVLDQLMSEDIQAALAKLAPEFRMAIMLSDVEEFTYKEIAEIMDCPVGTVMSRLYRARRQLQRHLLQHARDAGWIDAEEAEEAEAETNNPGALVAEVTDLDRYRQNKQR